MKPPELFVQDRLIEVLKNLLFVDSLSLDDDLLEVGLNSMTATKLVANIQDSLGVLLSLHEVFDTDNLEVLNVKSLATFIIKKYNSTSLIAIPQLPDEDYYELSYAQKRLWLIEKYNNGRYPSNIPLEIVFTSGVDIEFLEKTLYQLVYRHESLRTSIEEVDGQPLMRIHRKQDVYLNIELLDISATTNGDKELYLRKEALKEAQFIFDLSKSPLLKCKLVRLDNGQCHCFVTIHHIISDGWSVEILLKELKEIYNGLQENRAVTLSEPDIQFKDFAAWSNQRMDRSSETNGKFWGNQLSGQIPALDIPFAKKRPPILTHSGHRYTHVITENSHRILKQISVQNDCTLFTVLVGLLNILFYKYTNSSDIILGTSISERSNKQLQKVVGYFLNVVPIRNQFNGHTSFRNFLREVKNTINQIFKHQNYPFDQMLHRFGQSRDMSRSPLFDIVVLLHNYENSLLPPHYKTNNNDNGDLRIFESDNETCIVDLFLEFFQYRNELILNFRYNLSLYEENNIVQIIDHFEHLIQNINNNFEKTISSFSILPPSEEKLIKTFGDRTSYVDTNLSIIDLLFGQANQRPDSVALIFEDKFITYKKLGECIHTVAYLLNRHKIAEEDRIVVFIPRSDNLLISMLAIWYINAVYVPVDIDTPYWRLFEILEDCQPQTVIVEDISVAEKLKRESSINTNIVTFDSLFCKSLNNPIFQYTKIKSDTLAYIIYTSGSTGRPKGVMVEHLGMLNHLYAKIEALKICQYSRIAQNASQSFDISIWQNLAALMKGGTTVIIGATKILQPVEFVKKIFVECISILQIVPSYMSALFDHSKLRLSFNFKNLEVLIATGEELHKGLVKKWFQCCPNVKLMNAYGPTEASDDITHFFIEEALEGERIPIGKPIPNAKIYILDESLLPCPIGVKGEICVTGIVVGRGYLNDYDQTLARFVPNPFNPKAKKLYKTGDIGKWRPDGSLEFFGRKDDQIKLHGFRIELGEIESKISALGGVKQVVAVLKKTSNVPFIAAFIVKERKAELTEGDLQAYLYKRIPEYMIPSSIQFTNSLPTTINGKIDRKYLEKLPSKHSEKAIEKPKNIQQQRLMIIWQNVLKRRNIGINENFFEIGGHSLLAHQVVTRIHKEFNLKIELNKVFKHPTIEKLATEIINGVNNEYVDIPKIPESENYPMSHAQKRLWILHQMEAIQISYNVHGAYLYNGNIDIATYCKAIDSVIARHETLRTKFDLIEGEPCQVVIPTDDFCFNIQQVDLLKSVNPLQLAKEDIKQQIKIPFNLASSPPFRIKLYHLSDKELLFFIVIHHIISDGWSRNILEQEILNAYYQIKNSNKTSLPTLRIQYKDYTEWQLAQIRNGDLKLQREYWLNKLGGKLPRLNLPTYQPRPEIRRFAGKILDFKISPLLKSQINAVSHRNGNTLFMTLTSYLLILFSKLSHQNNIILGTTIAGRYHKDLENLVGFFVNTLPLYCQINNKLSFNQFTSQVKELIIKAFENDQYPFDVLIEDLDPERDLSRSAIFDVLIEVHQFDVVNRVFHGNNERQHQLSITPVDINEETSIYDLNLIFIEELDDIKLKIRYDIDLFTEDTIRKWFGYFVKIVEWFATFPDRPIASLHLDDDGKAFEIPYVHYSLPQGKTFVDLFNEQTIKRPLEIAIKHNDASYTYSKLAKGANKIANFLISNVSPKNKMIAIVMDRSYEMVKSIIGVMKAGFAYLPIDNEYPYERIKFLICDSSVNTIIISRIQVKAARILLWECDCLQNIICVDSNNILKETEEINESMKPELWEYIGETATDDITGGGWINSYTGKPFTREEMEEYTDNVKQKLLPILNVHSKVLEIGCASGLTMFQLAPLVGEYIGVDLSRVIIEKNLTLIREHPYKNIKLKCGYAHEIDQLGEKEFDVIILNSVIQNFNGYNYFEDVLSKSIRLLKNDGVIFLGDIMDLDLKSALIDSLESFKKNNPENEIITKTDWTDELFFSKKYLAQLKKRFPQIHELEHSPKHHTIKNELTEFRFDTIVSIKKEIDNESIYQDSYKKGLFDRRHLSCYSNEAPPSKPNIDDLAYIIYTSGSTGKPKGVMIEHKGMLNHLFAKINDLGLDSDSIITQNASHCFDISVWQFLSALVVGGKTVIYGNNDVRDVQLFLSYIKRDQITILELVPTYLSEILNASKEGYDCSWASPLNYLILTGETLHRNLVEKWFQEHTSTKLINAFGPTEASDDITHCIMTKCPANTSVSVGYPIHNLRIYVLNEQGEHCLPGVTGEIFVSGIGVGRGYINDPEQTSKVFQTDPFHPNARMYKTGDIGFFNPNGEIYFKGRNDSQVKIRGHRVELGEIETRILEVEGVSQVTVLFTENATLFAYFTTISGIKVSIEDIKAYLNSTLPEYMIPVEFIYLDSIPVNANNKVDRKKLLSYKNNKVSFRPLSAIERQLIDTWEKILNRQGINSEDNFFEIGGHSLKATRLITHIYKELGLRIELRDIFTNPTVNKLARVLIALNADKFRKIQPIGHQKYYDLSHSQQRIWIVDHFEEERKAYVLLQAKRIVGKINLTEFTNAFSDLMNRYEILRTVFETHQEIPKQRVLEVNEVEVPFEFFDLSSFPSVEAKLQFDTHLHEMEVTQFILNEPPLFRFRLFRFSEEEYAYILVMHHIISDGWSLDVFENALITLHDIRVFKGTPLKPLQIQYKDYASWYNTQLLTDQYQNSKRYWLKQFRKRSEPSFLPYDYPKPKLNKYIAGLEKVSLPPDSLGKLKTIAVENNATIFMMLQAFIRSLLVLKTGNHEIVIGIPVAGRNHPDLEDQIGCFLNTLPIKTIVEREFDFFSILDIVREACLNAFKHENYPYDLIVKDLSLLSGSNESKLFNIGFTYHDLKYLQRPDESFSLQGAELKFDTKFSTVKADLWIHAAEINERLTMMVLYNKSFYKRSTIDAFICDLVKIINSFLETGNYQISQLKEEVKAEGIYKLTENEKLEIKKNNLKKLKIK